MDTETFGPGAGDLAPALEQVEIAATRDLYLAGQGESAETFGLRAADFDTALGVMAARVDVLALNRVIGLGMAEPAREETVDRIVDWFAAAAVPRFFVQLTPAIRPDALPSWLEDRGFRPYNNWVRLHRTAAPPPDVQTDLRIEEIDRRFAADFGRINAHCFGWPQPVGGWVAQTVERPGWQHYMAFDGAEPVATGALFAHGGAAWFGFAATLPEHRGRGAQGALLARRIQDAAVLGCNVLSLETAQPAPGRDAPSFRNVLRMGFQQAYLRANYILARSH